MSAEDESLLQAIIDSPDDDVLRLVYADWLEENKDAARAEFIRVQCSLARLAEYDPGRGKLLQREQALRAAHEAAWIEPLGKLVLPKTDPAFGWEFQRGFVECVTTTAHRFFKFGDLLFRQTPVQHLRLTFVKDREHRVAACPYLARLKSLTVSDKAVRGQDAWILATSPHLTCLTMLRLSHLAMGNAGAEHLARVARLPQLRELDLSNNRIGDAGTAALAASALVDGLAILTLSANRMGSAGARALALSAGLAGLQALYVGANPFRDEGAQVLRARFGDRVHF